MVCRHRFCTINLQQMRQINTRLSEQNVNDCFQHFSPTFAPFGIQSPCEIRHSENRPGVYLKRQIKMKWCRCDIQLHFTFNQSTPLLLTSPKRIWVLQCKHYLDITLTLSCLLQYCRTDTANKWNANSIRTLPTCLSGHGQRILRESSFDFNCRNMTKSCSFARTS